MSNRPHLIHVNINQPSLQAVRGEGIYLYDAAGNRIWMDAAVPGGHLGHGAGEIARAMAAQSETLPYVFGSTSPAPRPRPWRSATAASPATPWERSCLPTPVRKPLKPP